MRSLPRVLAALLAFLVLAGCGTGVDPEQVRICRMALPALHPEAERFDILRADAPAAENTVRIDYRITRPDRAPTLGRVVCGFAASGLSRGRMELVSVTTARGPLSGASLFLLKRYWLETPDAVLADPGGRMHVLSVPELPRSAAYGLQQALAGLPKTAIYGLLAAAYALVFGLVGRINLAFGEIAAIGAAGVAIGVGLALANGIEAPLMGLGAGFFLCLGIAAAHNAVGGHFAIARVHRNGVQASLIATVGLSIALLEYMRLAFGTERFWLTPIGNDHVPVARADDFVVTVTPVSLAVTGGGLLAAGLVIALLHATRFGRAWRAYSDDPLAAALMGVAGPRLLTRTLALSGAIAGLSGFLVVVQYGSFGYADGFVLGLKALIGAVLGGVGSVGGAFLGGLLIGLFEVVWSATMPIEARDIALYIGLVALLVFKPGGLFGYGDGRPRQV